MPLSSAPVSESVLFDQTSNFGAGPISTASVTAVEDYQALKAADDGVTFSYKIKHMGDGTDEWEVGRGTYNDSTDEISRSAGTVLDGTNGAGSLVTFSAGTKRIAAVLSADDFSEIKVLLDALDGVAASRLLGRGSAAGAGTFQELTLSANLALAGTELGVTGLAPVVTLTAGDGLAGGGDTSADRTFDVDIAAATDKAAPTRADQALLSDTASADAIVRSDLGTVVDLADHDALANYDANEHVDHTAVTLTAGDGLSGGGTIAAGRTFDVDINGTADLAAPAVADELLISDADNANAIRKADVASVVNLADHDALTNFVADEHVAHSGVTLTASTGLSGGGDISANRSFSLSHLGIESLTDPGADRIMFWDETTNAVVWLTAGSGLSITGTTMTASAGSPAMNDITDATIDAVTTDEVLQWSGTAWVNQTFAEAGIAPVVTLTAGAGLTGGGDTSANRTFDIDINGTTDLASPAVGDELLLGDIDNGNAIRKADVASVVNLADHDALTNFVADEHVAHASVTLTAGDGLSGGGTIAASRTFNVDMLGLEDLTDPGADRIYFWDNGGSASGWLSVESDHLEISGTELRLSTALTDIGEAEGTQTTSGAITLNCEIAQFHSITLSGNATSLTISNLPTSTDAVTVTVRVVQDATGNRTWAHPTGIDWPGGTAPTMSSGAFDYDVIAYVTWDNGTTWAGFVGGLDFS